MTSFDGENQLCTVFACQCFATVGVQYLLRCENLLTASWFWLECCSFGKVFSFSYSWYERIQAVQLEIYECFRYVWIGSNELSANMLPCMPILQYV